MQISDWMRGLRSVQAMGKLPEVRQDQTVQVSIKQKLSSQEALVEINGQEFEATFEKGVPAESRVSAQVMARNGETLQLRVNATAEGASRQVPPSEAVIDRMLQEAGVKASPEMKEAVKRIAAERMPITKDVLRTIQHIMQKGEGGVQQKIDTLTVMAKKDITITPKAYEAVSRVLHGPSLGSILSELAKEAPDFLPPAASKDIVTNGVSPAAQKKLTKQLEVLEQALKSERPINKEAVQKLIEQIKQNVQSVKPNPDIRQAIDKVVGQVEEIIHKSARQKHAISPEQMKHGVDRAALERAINQLKQPAQAARQEGGDTRIPLSDKEILRQIDTIQQNLQQQQPITREQLQRLIQQIEKNLDVSKRDDASRQQLQKSIQILSKMAQALPERQPVVLTESASRSIGTELTRIAEQVQAEAATTPDAQLVKETAGQATSPTKLQDLAKLVQELRSAGRVTRAQLDQLMQTVKDVVNKAGLSPKLAKDIEALTERLIKDLRMSMSYEAVGKSGEAKAIVTRNMDTLVQLFKLSAPVSVLPGEGQEGESSSAFLRPIGETFARLAGIVLAARHDMIQALMDAQEATFKNLDGIQEIAKVVENLSAALRDAAIQNSIPKEQARQMDTILQRIEAMATGQERSTEPATVLQELDGLEQFLREAGERAEALTGVQTTDFERITRYIPDYLREAGEEFIQTKKEIMSNVQRMSQFLQQNIPQAASYVQRIIEPTIELVNRLVTKGEFALFADMEFEHSILKISGELQQVKGLLDKGKQDEALQIFQRVRGELEKLHWQPSYTKVERFFSKMTGEGEMRNPLQMYGQQWREDSLTGRGVQEAMRGMGLNYEREAAEWLVRREAHPHTPGTAFGQTGHHGQGRQDAPPHTLKSLMMEGMNDPQLTVRAKEVMDQALSHVTGQQLLSRQDGQTPFQSLHVQLPIPWEEGTQSVELQVQSRTNGEQMDWENCSLFFFLDTPKFGETGISVLVAEREMTLRIQNDHPNVEAAFSPYIPKLTDELQKMGYRIHGVTFTPIVQPVAGEEKQQPVLPHVDAAKARAEALATATKEGVDFSI
ncbi:hypothetical protein [Aneurinibacillus aneurinilyticus]|uniref:Uncharacterized protein n=1 Tax=Aneurinibacillus aneurinilyticus TaxID=1391 RepID=A0A848D161_ANEAE|nr:hypothetical protein [Aneurinibacillus aneurinilyticus]NME99817.1 hypothetical protein [Aneurinibacillus aneurinilyticus]